VVPRFAWVVEIVGGVGSALWHDPELTHDAGLRKRGRVEKVFDNVVTVCEVSSLEAKGRTMRMNIATALRRIKALKNTIGTLTVRMKSTVLFDADAAPAFDFEKTVVERETAVAEMLRLETLVAKKNATCRLDEGHGPLAISAIRELQELKSRISLYNELPTQPREEKIVKSETVEWDYEHNPARRVKVEVHTRFLCKLPEAQKAVAVEGLKAQFENLNARLESFNHSTYIED